MTAGALAVTVVCETRKKTDIIGLFVHVWVEPHYNVLLCQVCSNSLLTSHSMRAWHLAWKSSLFFLMPPIYPQIGMLKHTLTGQKKVAHCNILLDRLMLWLRSAFAVALFRQPYAMSQRLFPSRIAIIFGQDFVLMTGESNHSFSLLQHIPKTFNEVKSGLSWQIHVRKWLLMLPDTHLSSCSTLDEPDEPWHCSPGICLSHQGRNNPLMR